MGRAFTVPVVAYYEVEVEANDAWDAISKAESHAQGRLPFTVTANMKASGAPQCEDKDVVFDQEAKYCRTDDCNGDADTGDSYDGYCPSCADRFYGKEED